jgi:type I restriction enzyme S subunit
MNYELLADVAQVIMGQSPPSSTYNAVGEGLPFYQGKTDFGDMYPTPRVYCTAPSRIAETGDILISVRAPVGPTNVSQERSCIGRGISAIRVGEKLERDFLLYFLRFYEPELAKAGTGSTFTAIAREDLETIKIPLPPLTEQKRIASLLARADRLRQLRRTAHDLGDALLQSVFLEMFGDVFRNEKGWKIMSLRQTCDEIYRYPTFYGFDYVEDGAPVVRIGDILLNGEVNPNLENYVRISPEINKRFPRTILELGDILMAVRGDGSTGKRIGMVKSKNLAGSNISPNLLRFKANEKYVSPTYLFTFMTSSGGQELIDRYITRTAKKTITSADIQTIKIPVPPLSLQDEFAGVVARVESLRGRMGESTRGVEGFFESLLSETFEQ